MPGFVEAVGTLYAAAAGTATVSTASVLAAAVTVASYTYAAYSIVEARKQASKARDAANASLSDRLVTVRNSAAEADIVYGRARVAGKTIAYYCNHGSAREYATLVIPLAPHEIDAIEGVWMNDTAVGTLDGNGYVTSGGFYRGEEKVTEEALTGGNVSSTITLAHTPIAVMAMAVPTVQVGEGLFEAGETLVQDVDFSISGTTLTWLTNQTGKSLVITYRWSANLQLVRVKKFLGAFAGARDTDLETNSGGEWTADHLGCGIARVHVTLRWDDATFGQIGFPNITAIVRGKKVFNWVTGVTAWSNNAALCTADYLMDANGFDMEAARINTTVAIAAQNACASDVPAWPIAVDTVNDRIAIDGPDLVVGQTVRFYNSGGALPSPLSGATTYYIVGVTGAGTASRSYQISTSSGGSVVNLTTTGTGDNRAMQARYTVDGVISTGANRRDNLKLLTGAMVGKAIYSGGEWRIKAGLFANPVFTIDESDLADGPITITPYLRRQDSYNGVQGAFVDPTNLYQTGSFPPYFSDTFETEDGQRIVADISLPLTQDAKRAQRVAKRMLYEHRQALSITANFKLRTVLLQPGDTVYVKLAQFGWDTMNSGAGKLFVVSGDRRMSPTGVVQMTLVETSDAIDDWTYSEATNPDPAPNTYLPDPNYVPPLVLADPAFVSGADTYTQLTDGTIIPYGELHWEGITASAVLENGRIEIQWKRAFELSWHTIKCAPDAVLAQIAPISAGEMLLFQCYVYNGAGTRSKVTTATIVASSDIPAATNADASSGNLLADPTFVGGVDAWRLLPETGLSDGVLWQKDGAMSGSPAVAICYQNGTQTKYQLVQSPQMAVVAGQSYCAYASAMPWRCQARVQISWLTMAGAFISASFSETLGPQLPSLTDPRSEGLYLKPSFFAVAPAGAAFAVMQLFKTGTASGGDSQVYWFKPFFGPVAPNQYQLPPWNAGTAPIVSEYQLTQGAATEVWNKELRTSTAYAGSRTVCSITITPTFTSLATLTAQLSVTHRNVTDPGTSVLFEITSSGTNTPRATKEVGSKLEVDAATALPSASDWGYVLDNKGATLATGSSGSPTPIKGSAQGSRVVGLEAGKQYTFGITVTNDGAVTIPASNQNTIDFASLRIEQIKR